MRRIYAIARTEFLGLVRSKVFIIGILFMPVLILGFTVLMNVVERRVDREDRRFAVVDMTGTLYPAIETAARAQNADAGEGDARTGPRFLPERVPDEGRSREALVAALSDRVRGDTLFAFLYIPANALEPGGASPAYYSENTSYTRLSSWLQATLNEAIQAHRLTAAGFDPVLVATLIRQSSLDSFGLAERRPDGTLAAREVNPIQQFGVPVFFLVLMFMAVMSNAQHLTSATIEEKISKISEVLLGSVSSFQLMAGKLLGIVAVSLVLALIYLFGGAYLLLNAGRPDLIDPVLIGWFLVFMVCATLLYGAMFLALSSACSDLKDAHSLIQPVMILLMVAYLGSFTVLRAPDSTVAVVMSFVPMLTPFAMTLRLAVAPGPPLWQLLLSVVILVGVTIGAIWVAGRIFRVGLLMQGKAPTLRELVRWVGR